MAEELNIYQRLNEVRKAIEYIKKDARVQGYSAVTHDMVTSEVRPVLIEHGVMTIPRLIKSHVADTGTSTQKGVPIIRYEAWFEIDFVNIDKPEDKATMPIESHANDQGDKAPGKACSYAVKTALLKVLNIETGVDDESRQEQKPKPISESQHADLIALCDELGLPPETLDAMATRAFMAKSIDELHADRFDEAVKLLRKKADAESAKTE